MSGKNKADDDGSACDDSDDDSTDNEDWNAGYEGNGPTCEFQSHGKVFSPVKLYFACIFHQITLYTLRET